MSRIIQPYFILFFTLITAIVNAQPNNFEKAFDSFEEGRTEAAKEYFDLELGDNKRNAIAYFYRANINILYRNYNEAFDDLKLALNNFGPMEKDWKAATYVIRGKLYLGNEQIKKAISDFDDAGDINLPHYEFYIYRNNIYPKNKSNLLQEVPMLIISINKIEMLKLSNYYNSFSIKKEYKKAKKVLDLMIRLDSQDAEWFHYRAKLNYNTENYDGAIIDIIKSFTLNQDNKIVQDLVLDYAMENYMLAISQLSEELLANPNSILLHFLKARIYDKKSQFAEAIPEYTLGLLLINEKYRPWLLQHRARALKKIDMFDRSIEDFDLAIKMDPTDSYSFSTRADVYALIEKYDLALEGYSNAIALKPNQSFNYLRRGRAKEKYFKNYEGALEDYNTAIELDSLYYYNYFKRFQLYLNTLNDTVKANYDLNKILTLDTTIDDNGMHRPFALLYLNRIKEAKKWITKVIKKYPSGSNYYGATCFYSLIHEKEKAIKYLNLALEKGYRELKHIDGDDFMDNIRYSKEYIETMSKWKILQEETAKKLDIYLMNHKLQND